MTIYRSKPINRTHLSKVEAAGLKNQAPRLPHKNRHALLNEEYSDLHSECDHLRFGIAAEEITKL